ncbi:penicillin-binding protein 1C [Providencia sp. Me31A]|uniref:penicillin-binding protein 1C n=1 Tax=Providencia sp. Me31A TaxID=3392637 RepID=UPI003D2D007E
MNQSGLKGDASYSPKIVRSKRLIQNILMLFFLFALFCLCFRLWPHPSLNEGLPLSTVYYDKNGQLMRLTLANDDRYRLWTKLDDISPLVVDGVMRYEDRFFYYHPGFNPYSLGRGFFVSYVFGQRLQGGSTLTMQLARMRWQLNTRTIKGKSLQILRAIQLELSYSKKDILEAYFNYAPYGRNIESIGAASLIYFNKKPIDLTLPEALTLAVLPQSPSYRIEPNTHEISPTLTQARNRLFHHWLEEHPQDRALAALFELPLVLRQPEKMPYIAPHFIEQLIQSNRYNTDKSQVITTTIDADLQRLVERQVDAFIERHQHIGLHNAAVLLVDTQDMGIRALVGSSDYYNARILGQNNGTNAKRSPGSTLKPFIYALGIDQGILHPLTILKDVSTSFGNYHPENFDLRFLGPISATNALNYSRNIPAVEISSQLKSPNLYQFLQASGVNNMASESHYGLSLVLGGGEITAQELAKLYGILANRGELRSLRFDQSTPIEKPIRLLSEEASFITLDMLAQHRRPGSTLAQKSMALPVYWKTGTSWGFRDAWSSGIFGNYVLIVWLGNFDNKGNSAFIGAEAAAPLFFNIIDNIIAEYPNLKEPSFEQPQNLKQEDVCLASGNLPSPWCQRRGKTWFIPGKSPIKIDTIYRPVAIDKITGEVVCPPYNKSDVNIEIFEYWPSDLAKVFELAGLSKKKPPSTAHCLNGESAITGLPPKIISPLSNTTYTFRRTEATTTSIVLNATTDNNSSVVYWFVNDAYIGSSTSKQTIEWKPTVSGQYQIRAVDDKGKADIRNVQVDIIGVIDKPNQ